MSKLQEYYESTGGIVDLDCTVEQADAMLSIAKECMAPFVDETAKNISGKGVFRQKSQLYQR